MTRMIFRHPSTSASGAALPSRTLVLWVSTLALVCLFALSGCSPSNSSSADPALRRFAEAKKARTRAWVEEQKLTIPHEAWGFFDATIAGRWEDATNAYAALPGMPHAGGAPANPSWKQFAGDKLAAVLAKLGYKRKPPTALQTEVRVPLSETYGALEEFRAWDNRLLHVYGETIIGSIPTNSIYFGGTGAGRFLVSALCESQMDGRPFFTLTQNALADGTYRAYLQNIYGRQMVVPSADDSQKAFTTYLADAQRRLAQGRLKPGESVAQSAGRVTVSGLTAVMEINGLLTRVIFDQNPGRDFFLEESWPLDWMCPHLSPHGPVLRINRQPLSELPEPVVLQDREYWRHLAAQFIGDAIQYDTTLPAACHFVRRVYLAWDLTGFTGELRYVRNGAAQTGFSNLRKAIAGVYAWRAGQAKSPEERERMLREAEFAYRQAFALGPGNGDAVEPYARLLISQNRLTDAVALLQTSLAVCPGDPKLGALLKSLTEK